MLLYNLIRTLKGFFMLRTFLLGFVLAASLTSSWGADAIENQDYQNLFGKVQTQFALSFQKVDLNRVVESLNQTAKKTTRTNPVWAVVEALLKSETKQAFNLAYSIIDEGHRSRSQDVSGGILATLGYTWGGTMNETEKRIYVAAVGVSFWADVAGASTRGMEKNLTSLQQGLLPMNATVLKGLLDSSFPTYDYCPEKSHYTKKDARLAKVSYVFEAILEKKYRTVQSNANPLLDSYIRAVAAKDGITLPTFMEGTNPSDTAHTMRQKNLKGVHNLFQSNTDVLNFLSTHERLSFPLLALWPTLSWQHVELLQSIVENFEAKDVPYMLKYVIDPLFESYDAVVSADARHIRHNVRKFILDSARAIHGSMQNIKKSIEGNPAALKWLNEQKKLIADATYAMPILTYPGQENNNNAPIALVMLQFPDSVGEKIESLIKSLLLTAESNKWTYILDMYADAFFGDKQISERLNYLMGITTKPQIAGGPNRLTIQ